MVGRDSYERRSPWWHRVWGTAKCPRAALVLLLLVLVACGAGAGPSARGALAKEGPLYVLLARQGRFRWCRVDLPAFKITTLARFEWGEDYYPEVLSPQPQTGRLAYADDRRKVLYVVSPQAPAPRAVYRCEREGWEISYAVWQADNNPLLALMLSTRGPAASPRELWEVNVDSGAARLLFKPDGYTNYRYDPHSGRWILTVWKPERLGGERRPQRLLVLDPATGEVEREVDLPGVMLQTMLVGGRPGTVVGWSMRTPDWGGPPGAGGYYEVDYRPDTPRVWFRAQGSSASVSAEGKYLAVGEMLARPGSPKHRWPTVRVLGLDSDVERLYEIHGAPPDREWRVLLSWSASGAWVLCHNPGGLFLVRSATGETVRVPLPKHTWVYAAIWATQGI